MTAPTPPLSAEARLAALRQSVEALADEWEAEVARGHWCGECFAEAAAPPHHPPRPD